LQGTLSPLYSNAPVGDARRLPDPLHSQAHTVIDLGDEFFMTGRLHPMIDNDLRIRRLRQEAADPEVGMLLLDVVLGEGSHSDPAGELAPVISQVGRPGLDVVAIVVGTDEDPQNVQSQVRQLKDAGVVVFRTVAEAVNYINLKSVGRWRSGFPPVDLDGLVAPVHAINVGLESFYESLLAQGAPAVQVDWRPPAGGNEKLAALLSRMKKGSDTGA
jgi:FdrA protein